MKFSLKNVRKKGNTARTPDSIGSIASKRILVNNFETRAFVYKILSIMNKPRWALLVCAESVVFFVPKLLLATNYLLTN